MLVDSKRVGLTPFDLNIPTTHGNLADLGYALDIIENNNALIGIAPTMIYHDDAGYSPKVRKPFEITEENKDQVNKSAKQFLKSLDKKLLCGNPKIEIVFLDTGEIDYNETIGGHYLKNKHPNIYKEIVARPHYHIVHTSKKERFTNQIHK